MEWKRKASVAFLFGAALFLQGCWDRVELDEVAIVSGFGMDYDNKKAQVVFTSQAIQPGVVNAPTSGSGGAGGSGANAPAVIIEGRGETVFDAIRNSSLKSGRRLHYTHSEIAIFGREAVQHGLHLFLDSMLRDPEPRPNILLLVADGRPRDIFEARPIFEKVTATMIRGMVEKPDGAAKTKLVTLHEFVGMLLSKTRSAILPIIRRTRGKEDDAELRLDGMAVFKGDRIAGRLTPRETRGLLWVIGEVRSGVIVVKPQKGERVSLQIIKASARIRPEIKGDAVKVKVDIQVITNLGDQTFGKNYANPLELKGLERHLKAAVCREIAATVQKAALLRADVFGFGESIAKAYPKQWRTMERKWARLFPELQPTCEVEA